MAEIKVWPVAALNTQISALKKADVEEGVAILKTAGFVVTRRAPGRGVSRRAFVVAAPAEDVGAALAGLPHTTPMKGQALLDYVYDELINAQKMRTGWGTTSLTADKLAQEAELPTEIVRRELKKLEKRGLAHGSVSRDKVGSSAGGSIIRSVTFWSPRGHR